jgi:ribosomal subunit interface protein
MNIEVRGVHCEIAEDDRKLIDKKVERLHSDERDIVSMHFVIVKEKAGYKFEATVHFHWGNQIFIHCNGFDIHEGIDQLFKKISVNITKEKERIKAHKPAGD